MGEAHEELGTYTSVSHALANKIGVMAALVYGDVWGICRFKNGNGTCYASLETIAGRTGIDKRTVLRMLKKLVAEGYIEDKTPNRRNAPHVYVYVDLRDTAKIEANRSRKEQERLDKERPKRNPVGEFPTRPGPGVKESQSGVTESQCGEWHQVNAGSDKMSHDQTRLTRLLNQTIDETSTRRNEAASENQDLGDLAGSGLPSPREDPEMRELINRLERIWRK